MAEPSKILVVDDELGIREGCRRVLEPQGFVVDVASSIEEGLERVKADRYDLAILDVMMPDGRGIDLLAPIREKDPNTVSLIITGYATVELAVEAINAGAYDFISKPFSAEVLRLAVSKGLERRRLWLESQRVQALEAEAAALALAREELERIDAFKTGFMLTVAHELRAPLTAIQSFLMAILKGYIPAEQQDKTLRRAIDRAQDLLDLVDDLLQLAVVKREQAPDQREVVSLADSLDEVAGLQGAYADARGVHFALDMTDRPQVEANPAQLAQVWTNLISNAIKYTPAHGRVRITLSEQDGWAIGAVEDTGIGIAPEDLGRIFEEFYRAPQAKEIDARGTGLGLPLVKRIVEGLGGTIEVKSALGQGSRFAFRLPTAARVAQERDSKGL